MVAIGFYVQRIEVAVSNDIKITPPEPDQAGGMLLRAGCELDEVYVTAGFKGSTVSSVGKLRK